MKKKVSKTKGHVTERVKKLLDAHPEQVAKPRTGKTLLSDIRYPKGFDENGRKCLGRCPEFTVYEMFREGGEQVVEAIPEIERAYWRYLYGVTERGSEDAVERRVDWAIALDRLARFSQLRAKNPEYVGGSVTLAIELSQTLGIAIIDALESGDPDANDIGNWVRNSIKNVAVGRGKKGTQRDGFMIPMESEAILLAKSIYQNTLRRPSKGRIQYYLKSDGYGFNSNTRVKWEGVFARAGLADLPDSYSDDPLTPLTL